MSFDILEAITSKEFIATFSSLVAGASGVAYKAYKEITKKIEAQGAKTAEVVGRAIHSSIEDAIDNHRHTRSEQFVVAEFHMEEYATAVTVTAPEMAKTLVCASGCGTIDEIAEIWGFAVKTCIVRSGMSVFAKVINRNGFTKMTADEFDDLIDNLSGIPRKDGRKRETNYDLFDVFANSMLAYFKKEKIKVRVQHIRQTIDRYFLRQTVSNIMYECLELSRQYHATKENRANELSDQIKREIK